MRITKQMGDPAARFWQRVGKAAENDCWLWTGRLVYGGYGTMHIYGQKTRVHRYSYEMHKGPIPAGMEIRHMCHTPRCVNPGHLEVGTHAQNMRDMADSGRRKGIASIWGELHGRAKVTENQVLAIRHAVASGATQQSQCLLYGLGATQVSRIIRREGWTHA